MPNNIDNDEEDDYNPKAGNQNQKDEENMDIDLDF